MLYLATETGLYEIDEAAVTCRKLLDVDSARRVCDLDGTLYCAAEKGLWSSEDNGASWQQVFQPADEKIVTALEISTQGQIYLGTEMSAVFFSPNRGEHWQRSEGLEELPSSSEWSFPPRPDTHHVRWLHSDPGDPRRLYAAIEAGALLRSLDRGISWLDRVEGGPIDTHHLAIHPARPDRVWSAAGDGIFCSEDKGDTWERCEQGLEFSYGWSIAIDSGDPNNILLSVAPGPRQAHSKDSAFSTLYRKPFGTNSWTEVRTGLPSTDEHCAFVLASDPRNPGAFHASSGGQHTYHSLDGGETWHQTLPGKLPSTGRCNDILCL